VKVEADADVDPRWMRHYWLSGGSRLPRHKRHSACNYGNMVLASCLHRARCHRVARSSIENL